MTRASAAAKFRTPAVTPEAVGASLIPSSEAETTGTQGFTITEPHFDQRAVGLRERHRPEIDEDSVRWGAARLVFSRGGIFLEAAGVTGAGDITRLDDGRTGPASACRVSLGCQALTVTGRVQGMKR